MTALGTRVPGLVPPAALSLAAGLPDTIAMHLSRERIPRASRANSGAPVVMQFIGCVMDSVYADTNRKTYEVLTAVGYDVRVPPSQRCCGALHVHAGHPETAREWAKINIAAFEQSGADAMAINAAGCGAALKEYPALLQQETGQWVERAERFAEAVHDVSRIISEGDFPTLPARGVTVTMHDACHLAHAQGIRQEPRHLLQKAGYHLIEMEEPDRCCGSAGVYNLTHPAMAQALQDKKVADIPDEAEVVVTGNPGCQMQIQAGLRKHGRPTPVRHTVDLIWQALSDAHHIPEKAEVRGGVKLES